jgi:hypothetical protein
VPRFSLFLRFEQGEIPGFARNDTVGHLLAAARNWSIFNVVRRRVEGSIHALSDALTRLSATTGAGPRGRRAAISQTHAMPAKTAAA